MTEIVDFAALLQDAKTGAAWPEGDYDFEVIEADAVTAQTGAPMVKTKFRCIVGAYANKTITNNFVLSKESPGALRMFFTHMAAFGLGDDYFTALGNGNLVPVAAALRGRRIRLTLGPREWPKGSGILQNEVRAVKPITEGIAGAVAPTPGFAPTMGAGPQIPAAPQAVPPQVQAQPAFVPPPPQAIPQAPPTVPPAPAPATFVPPAPPAPQAQVQAPVVAPPPVAAAPQPAPAPAPVPNGVPAGFTPEQWAALPEATRNMILASQQPQVPQAPAQPAVPQASAMNPPAPPGLPV